MASDEAQGFDSSHTPSLSANHRYVAFSSRASNLVPDDLNARRDIFIREVQDGVTWRVSVGYDGTAGNDASFNPALSADGLFAGFSSRAKNLVPDDFNEIEDVFRVPATP